jgi:hypothetical protein
MQILIDNTNISTQKKVVITHAGRGPFFRTNDGTCLSVNMTNDGYSISCWDGDLEDPQTIPNHAVIAHINGDRVDVHNQPEIKESEEFTYPEILSNEEYLILETLMARYRLGKEYWSFPTTFVEHMEALVDLNMINWKNATTEGYIVAWYTDENKKKLDKSNDIDKS